MKSSDHQKIIAFLQSLLLKLISQIKNIYNSQFRGFALAVSGIMLILLFTVCGLLLNFITTDTVSSQNYSVTEIAGTIYAEIDLKTNIAETIYAQFFTATPDVTLIPEEIQEPINTINPYQDLYNSIPCLPANNEIIPARVISVTDGDSINVEINGQIFPVRYIGVDCPESNSTNQIEQTIYQSALESNKYMVENQNVLLVKDISETDTYNRLLRYVIVGNTFINYELVRIGQAYSVDYPPDSSCSQYFESAQNQAKNASIGLWQPVVIYPTNTPLTEIIPESATSVTNSNCDPSYPDFCIAPYPPDLDCGDISRKNFTVLPPDPHGFDRDGDGIGCES